MFNRFRSDEARSVITIMIHNLRQRFYVRAMQFPYYRDVDKKERNSSIVVVVVVFILLKKTGFII